VYNGGSHQGGKEAIGKARGSKQMAIKNRVRAELRAAKVLFDESDRHFKKSKRLAKNGKTEEAKSEHEAADDLYAIGEHLAAKYFRD
jgi:hypothetical protein